MRPTEYLVKQDPSSGSTITFFQFLFVALEGLRDYVTWAPPDGQYAAARGATGRSRRKRVRRADAGWWAGLESHGITARGARAPPPGVGFIR